MEIVGLTGSIAMGKSTVARLLGRAGVPVHDADACVHRLFARGGAAVAPVGRAFPGVISDGGVDRNRLGALVIGDAGRLRQLEAIVHPLVRADRDRFLARHRRRRSRLVVLDVPLLFESGGDAVCDTVLVVTAPAYLQRQRVLARPGMTPQRFADILRRQMPDRAKRRRADAVIHSGLGLAATSRELARWLAGRRRRSRCG